MNCKIWSQISLTLLVTAFSYQTQVHSAYYDIVPDNHTLLMNSPPQNYVDLNDPMNSPAMGFGVVDNMQGMSACYGLPESMIRTIDCYHNENVCDECCFPGLFRFQAEFAAGRFIAIDQAYGGLEFLAIPQSRIGSTNLLLDLRGFKLEHRNWAGSAGLGFRHLDKTNHKVYGLNAFYDYLDQSGTFNQWGLGFELFSRNWEFHLNGYLPVGKTHRLISERVRQFDAGFVGIFRENNFALRGVELTGGGRWDFCDNLYLYIAPGFYFYNNKDIGNIQGIQCNTEINWNDWVSFRLNASYDSKFRGRVQGIVALSFPLSFGCCPDTCSCACCPCDLLGRPIRRNDLIFLKRCCTVERNWDDCGHPVE